MDIILYNILVAFICFFIGYFFGSIPTAVWIGKIFFHKDLREYGSKNAGGTNAGRVFGKKIGALVIVLDILKSYTPVWIVWAILTFVPFGAKPLLAPSYAYFSGIELNTYIIQWPVYWLVSAGVIIGHCFPMFAQFKGGKGVAAYSAIVGTSWLFLIIYVVMYVLTLKWKKYVSFSSIFTAIASSVIAWIWAILLLLHVIPVDWCWFPNMGWTLNSCWVFATVLTCCALFTIIRHKTNIKRLIEGSESKITWMK